MKSKVTVVANADGNVVTPSTNNPEWASIRVKQSIVEMDNNFAKEKTRFAYIHGTTKMLSSWGYAPGQELDGNVVIRESLTPFNPKNPSADAKIAGTSGVVCRLNGATIYRKAFFETNPTKFNDELIAHNNIEEIQMAYEAAKNASEANADLSL